MFLTVLSAIALTVGSLMTVNDLSEEAAMQSQQTVPTVEVQAVQPSSVGSKAPAE